MDGPGITAVDGSHILGGLSAALAREQGFAVRLEYAAGNRTRLKHTGPRENPSEQWGGSGHLIPTCGRPPWTTATPLPFLEGGI